MKMGKIWVPFYSHRLTSKMWKFKTSQLPILAIFIVFLVLTKDAIGSKEKFDEMMGYFEDPNMDCKDVMALMGKKQISAVSACTKSLNFKSPKEKKERSSCILKCVLKNEHLLTDDGKFNNELINMLLEAKAPPKLEAMKGKAMAMFQDCRDKHEGGLDDSDITCKSYGALIKCLMGMTSLCMS